MRPSLDPLRYGLRALEEMSREQASVTPPAPSREAVFSPHPLLRGLARDGAALSLRLFGDTEDDATAFVVGDIATRTFAPIPPRASALFEAHAAALAAEVEATLTIGFPLVTFVNQGAARAAPLFSRGGCRLGWKIGDDAWKLPAGARRGAPLAIPDSLVLTLAADEPYTVHAGVWFYLFGLDGDALASIAGAGRGGIGPLARAATRLLEAGGEGAEIEPPAEGPLTREDLAALAAAAVRRAPSSRGLKAHPHGLAMLPPRGDPTSGLRLDLQGVVDEPLRPRGPLAVFLGGAGGTPRREPIFGSGRVPPTPSQLDAARAFEGTEDIVAVCGPPGCGKTALLHHVAAQTVVACALGTVWTKAPPRALAWPLVVTSTNNAAVDHALAPFVGGANGEHLLPVGIRLGNRRVVAESTAAALGAAMVWLETAGELSLEDARAAFESAAAPVRAFQRDRATSEKKRVAAADQRRSLEHRASELREQLARAAATPPIAGADLAMLEDAERALTEHAEAADRLPAVHLHRKKGGIARACEKWARANALRAPRILPVLGALEVAMPFGDLDPAQPVEDIARQRAAIGAAREAVARALLRLRVPDLEAELAAVKGKLAAAGGADLADPPLDAGLYLAALAVRDAWARAHREVFLPRLASARDAARAEWAEGGPRGKPLQPALRELAALFPVAGCTLLSMRASFLLGADVIDRLVIDEAAQCAPIYAVPAIARARRVMLTGDVAQLPPVYTLAPHVDERLGRGLDEAAVAPFRMSATSVSSAQAVAEPRARARLALTEHFRSQPAIVDLASRWSGYTLDVRTRPSSLADLAPRLDAPVIALPVPGSGARAAEGVVNDAEAAEAIALVEELVTSGVLPGDIAVLTPFVGQSVRIERELVARGLVGRDGVLVSTVHRLQGGERRVVIFSVTATERRHLRWLGERPHLLHVATSRAQDHLVILVDPDAADREPALAPLRELLQG